MFGNQNPILKPRRDPVRALTRIVILGILLGMFFIWQDSQRDDPTRRGFRATPTQDLIAVMTRASEEENLRRTPTQPNLTPSATPVPVTAFPTFTPSPLPPDFTPLPTATQSRFALVPTSTAQGQTLIIPSLNVFATVINVYLDGEAWDLSNLGNNVGYLQGTSRVDRGGNMVLAGHIETGRGEQAVFANLGDLQPGQPVLLIRNNAEFRYVVRERLVTGPDDLSILYPTDAETLTLITCGAYNLFDDLYEERIVVIAERVG